MADNLESMYDHIDFNPPTNSSQSGKSDISIDDHLKTNNIEIEHDWNKMSKSQINAGYKDGYQSSYDRAHLDAFDISFFISTSYHFVLNKYRAQILFFYQHHDTFNSNLPVNMNNSNNNRLDILKMKLEEAKHLLEKMDQIEESYKNGAAFQYFKNTDILNDANILEFNKDDKIPITCLSSNHFINGDQNPQYLYHAFIVSVLKDCENFMNSIDTTNMLS
ncbi:unnamed protein product [Gordionus sp. m RMFG-2023]